MTASLTDVGINLSFSIERQFLQEEGELLNMGSHCTPHLSSSFNLPLSQDTGYSFVPSERADEAPVDTSKPCQTQSNLTHKSADQLQEDHRKKVTSAQVSSAELKLYRQCSSRVFVSQLCGSCTSSAERMV
jgi:hypothetical protein